MSNQPNHPPREETESRIRATVRLTRAPKLRALIDRHGRCSAASAGSRRSRFVEALTDTPTPEADSETHGSDSDPPSNSTPADAAARRTGRP
jgi:hypothetical protein